MKKIVSTIMVFNCILPCFTFAFDSPYSEPNFALNEDTSDVEFQNESIPERQNEVITESQRCSEDLSRMCKILPISSIGEEETVAIVLDGKLTQLKILTYRRYSNSIIEFFPKEEAKIINLAWLIFQYQLGKPTTMNMEGILQGEYPVTREVLYTVAANIRSFPGIDPEIKQSVMKVLNKHVYY